MYGIVCLKTPDHRTWQLLVNIDRTALSITVRVLLQSKQCMFP